MSYDAPKEDFNSFVLPSSDTEQKPFVCRRCNGSHLSIKMICLKDALLVRVTCVECGNSMTASFPGVDQWLKRS